MSKHTSHRLLITHGFSGSGKTTGSQRVIEDIGAVRSRSDVERKRLLGAGPMDLTASNLQADAYSDVTTEQTYDHLARLAESTLRAGFNVVVDATFLQQERRIRFRQLAERGGVPFHILDFAVPIDQLHTRLNQRRQSATDASEADSEVLRRQLSSHDPLTGDEHSLAVSAHP